MRRINKLAMLPLLAYVAFSSLVVTGCTGELDDSVPGEDRVIWVTPDEAGRIPRDGCIFASGYDFCQWLAGELDTGGMWIGAYEDGPGACMLAECAF